MESQPQNPEFRNNPETFTHVYNENSTYLLIINLLQGKMGESKEDITLPECKLSDRITIQLYGQVV